MEMESVNASRANQYIPFHYRVTLASGDRDNLNVRGALLHMLGDALGSLGAMVASVGLMFGIRSADAAVSLFIAVLVLLATFALLRDSARVLRHRAASCATKSCAMCPSPMEPMTPSEEP